MPKNSSKVSNDNKQGMLLLAQTYPKMDFVVGISKI